MDFDTDACDAARASRQAPRFQLGAAELDAELGIIRLCRAGSPIVFQNLRFIRSCAWLKVGLALFC